MFKVKVLNQEVIKKTLGMKEVIEGVEKVYTLKAEERANVWPMIFHEFEPGVADMDIKSGYLKGCGYLWVKASFLGMVKILKRIYLHLLEQPFYLTWKQGHQWVY